MNRKLTPKEKRLQAIKLEKTLMQIQEEIAEVIESVIPPPVVTRSYRNIELWGFLFLGLSAYSIGLFSMWRRRHTFSSGVGS